MVKRQDAAAAQQSQNSFLVDLTRLTKTITDEGTELKVTGVDGDPVEVSGTVTIEPGVDPIVVEATDLDIRDLDSATDSVTAVIASLPLPAGAATEVTLAAAAASLSVLDDWDESDRAKVNPIVGQAGVQGGSGAVSALTQRVVLATDVALPAGTNNIGDVDVLTLPITAAVTPAAYTTNVAGASATYITALSSDEWRWLKFLNLYDTAVAISFDASTQHKVIPAGAMELLDLYANGVKITATVSWKYLTLPTRGDIYIEGLAV